MLSTLDLGIWILNPKLWSLNPTSLALNAFSYTCQSKLLKKSQSLNAKIVSTKLKIQLHVKQLCPVCLTFVRPCNLSLAHIFPLPDSSHYKSNTCLGLFLFLFLRLRECPGPADYIGCVVRVWEMILDEEGEIGLENIWTRDIRKHVHVKKHVPASLRIYFVANSFFRNMRVGFV